MGPKCVSLLKYSVHTMYTVGSFSQGIVSRKSQIVNTNPIHNHECYSSLTEKCEMTSKVQNTSKIE